MSDEPKRVIPEVVYSDSQSEQDARKRDAIQYYDSIKKLENSKYPFYLRLGNLFIAIFISVVSSIFIAFVLLFTLLAAITFFKNEKINQTMRKAWNLLFKLIVFWLGMVVAIFYPPLGYGLIVLYFTLRHEKLNNSFFGRLQP